MIDDPRQRFRELIESRPADDPTGWFDELYTEAESGRAEVPWDRRAPHPLLAQWALSLPAATSTAVPERSQSTARAGSGGRALVVGCGTGDDAELVAALGFDTVGFDVSPAAIRAATERYPSSNVDYMVADLFDPPAAWHQAFDLVVEVYTVQSLPVEHHARAIEAIASFVRGTLVVVAFARADDPPAERLNEVPTDPPTEQPHEPPIEHLNEPPTDPLADPPTDGPPWPLTRAEIDSFADHGLAPVTVDLIEPKWLAEFSRVTPRT